MTFQDFMAAIKGVEEFDKEFAQTQPSNVYVIVVTILKVLNRVTFTSMIFRFFAYLENFGITLPL